MGIHTLLLLGISWFRGDLWRRNWKDGREISVLRLSHHTHTLTQLVHIHRYSLSHMLTLTEHKLVSVLRHAHTYSRVYHLTYTHIHSFLCTMNTCRHAFVWTGSSHTHVCTLTHRYSLELGGPLLSRYGSFLFPSVRKCGGSMAVTAV